MASSAGGARAVAVAGVGDGAVPGDGAVLGLAMGTSTAVGYVDEGGAITNWLNELAFVPVDYQPGAPVDEWSQDRGVGASYFSQQCVFRLAPKVGIALPEDVPLAEKLKVVQNKLEGLIR